MLLIDIYSGDSARLQIIPFEQFVISPQKHLNSVLNFIVKDDVALAFYISRKEKFQELRPLNFLFYSIFEWCIKEKIKGQIKQLFCWNFIFPTDF